MVETWSVKMTGKVKSDRSTAFLAGHCPLTGRYFEPCFFRNFVRYVDSFL